MRHVMSIIGSGAGATDPQQDALAEALGRLAVDAGFRICCGGLGGVMTAACRGARRSERYTEGDTIGILPSRTHADANPFVDIAIPTELGYARNMLVVMSGHVVVAVAGRTGTLSEIALAWQIGRPVIALTPAGGWAARLAGQQLDGRRADTIRDAASPEEAVAIATALVSA